MSEKEVKVDPDQLQLGMYVSLSGQWDKHPFVLNSFKLKREKQIEIIKALGLREVLYVPSKSDRSPLPRKNKKPAKPSEKDSKSDENFETSLFSKKKQGIDKLKKTRDRIRKCSVKYKKTMEQMSGMMTDLFACRKDGVEAAEEVVGEMVDTFLAESEALVHLMSFEESDSDLAYHFVNVSVLSLMIGEAMGLSKPEMHFLGKGALLHDIGKLKIEKKYLRRPRETMNKHELELVQKHPEYGCDVLKKTDPDMPPEVLDTVMQHHEYLEGSGYPAGLTEKDIFPLAKIVTVANVYDNLTNNYDPQRSLTPHQALLKIFKEYGDLVDVHVFTVMVQRIGIYPPGSIVELNNGSLGKVMAVNPDMPLKPSLFIHDSEVPKKKAAIFDLMDEPELYIHRALLPSELSDEARRYLSPSIRLSYYADNVEE